jgi:hypothetical protein
VRRPSNELREFLRPFSLTTQDVALRLRRRVLMVVPNAHETVWDASNAVSIAFSTRARSGVSLCHVAVYSNHVNLGFAQGAELPDPDAVLTGTGRRIRHATFRASAETDAQWIDPYLRKALAMAGLDAGMGDGGTTIRVMQGPKRRPDPAK